MKSITAVTSCLLALASLAPIASAKSIPIEAPDPERGVIGVEINVIPPAKMGSGSALVVYFVRVVEDGDRFRAESLVSSNYAKGGSVYLLNAKPGRYVAVGCDFTMAAGGQSGTVVFSKADILQTEVEVPPGAVVFMGHIDVQSSTKTKDADEAEAHYLRMISPAASNHSTFTRALSGNYLYTGVFKSVRRAEAAADFWLEATEKHFKKDPAWSSRIAAATRVP